MFEGFKKFILRGNVVDLAVGVVVGASFNNVVQSLVKDIITPLIGFTGQIPNFSSFSLKLGNSSFMIGDFLNTFISFLIIATVIYFLIVVPINKFSANLKQKELLNIKKCPYCLSEVSKDATRCSFCTSMFKEKVK